MVGFRILGPLEVLAGGRPVPLGHAREQCVLAALVLDAGRPVPVGRLIRDVWGEDAGDQARNTLYTYVSRLRRVLGPLDVLLARGPGGYVLRVEEDAVDAHRFRRLVARAKSADDATALTLLDEGLALWRGEPLAGLNAPGLDAVREHLAAERREAELAHTDLMLRAGRHSECLAALSARAAALPLDERLAGQLLLALYRSGRPSEALERYRRTHRLLAEELGTEPGPALRTLHRQILDNDPALSLPAPPPATGGATAAGGAGPLPVPRQLPSAPIQFTGREREIAALDRALAEGPAGPEGAVTGRTVVLSGIGGIGKTWLALHWAHRHRRRFPDGQLYVDLRGFAPHRDPLPPALAMGSFLDALGVPHDTQPAEPQTRLGLYRSLAAGKRLLIVLDNARDAEQVRPLLPGSGLCTVIVTSRSRLPELIAADGARLLAPAALTDDEARGLLAHRLGGHRIAREAGAVASIVTACAGLPLALAVVAARALANPAFSLAMLAGELRDAAGGLDAFAEGGTALSPRSVFSWSRRALSDDADLLFRLLGVHPGPQISRPAAASLTGFCRHRTGAALGELVRAQLITEHLPGRYGLHDLVRAYAAELADDPANRASRHDALLRTVSHYTHTAHGAAALVERHRTDIALPPVHPGAHPEPLADSAAALEWLGTERPVLHALVALTTAAGLDGHTWPLAWTLSHVHARDGYLDAWLFAQTTGLQAAERLGDRLGQALSHRALTRVHTRLGHHAEAERHGTEALALFTALGDTTGRARMHLALGWMLDQQGRHPEALDHGTVALELYRSADDVAGQARALNAGAWSRTMLGDRDQALRQCEEALGLLRNTADRPGEAATWDTLAHAHHRFAAYDEAVHCYRQAIGLYRTLGDRSWEARTLVGLADTHEAAGDRPAARAALRQALAVYEDIGHPGAERLHARLAEG
ncbi:BTAD domain-containing putative transcriptional regulator [Kitasatospora sp. NPDC059463]|uniref:AfsR/SARP family transcriptional regulator n=1 Tax=unclassified Kitasatospora TaxID=2633591 RepID=UPI00367ACAE6